MKTLVFIGTLVAGVTLVAAAAGAQSTKTPQERMAREAAMLTGPTNATNRECGTAITVTFDWTGVKEEDLSTYSANGWCEATLEGIQRVCSDAPGKEAVKQKIKRVICGFGPERSISLKEDGTVDYKISFRSTNDRDFVYESLENAL
jgi:hypothetical protein